MKKSFILICLISWQAFSNSHIWKVSKPESEQNLILIGTQHLVSHIDFHPNIKSVVQKYSPKFFMGETSSTGEYAEKRKALSMLSHDYLICLGYLDLDKKTISGDLKKREELKGDECIDQIIREKKHIGHTISRGIGNINDKEPINIVIDLDKEQEYVTLDKYVLELFYHLSQNNQNPYLKKKNPTIRDLQKYSKTFVYISLTYIAQELWIESQLENQSVDVKPYAMDQIIEDYLSTFNAKELPGLDSGETDGEIIDIALAAKQDVEKIINNIDVFCYDFFVEDPLFEDPPEAPKYVQFYHKKDFPENDYTWAFRSEILNYLIFLSPPRVEYVSIKNRYEFTLDSKENLEGKNTIDRLEDPEQFEQIIVNRNYEWVNRINASFKENNEKVNIYTFVGVAHFYGQDGLIDLLNQNGYLVEEL